MICVYMKQGTERQRVWHPQSKSYALVWDVGRGVFYCWEGVVRKGRSSYGLSCSSYQPHNKRLELELLRSLYIQAGNQLWSCL